MRRPLVLALTVFATAAPLQAAAAPPSEPVLVAEPPVGVALAAGAATALIPLGLGALRTADGATRPARNAGFLVAGAGLALSPIISHIVVGEYARAAVFGAAPVAAEIAMIALTSVNPDAVFAGTTVTRTTFGVLFSVGVFGAALGLVDVALAGGRARERAAKPRTGLHVAPLFGGGVTGLSVGGIL
ncbi:Hypothetical protein A7982_10472 [Minicystis rosea]|nr:Hypothetical protein A7982_10472 [Minicystis rosea]